MVRGAEAIERLWKIRSSGSSAPSEEESAQPEEGEAWEVPAFPAVPFSKSLVAAMKRLAVSLSPLSHEATSCLFEPFEPANRF